MRVLLAPDSFAGTLTAAQAAAAMADGWGRARPGDELVLAPTADGGEGTLAVVEAAVSGCRRQTVEVANARGYAIDADWLQLPDGTALVESATACGLHGLPAQQRNPRLTTTYGVGQLLAAALEAGAAKVIVGLGGSATVDGGAGMATALGHRLLRADGNGVKVGGEYVSMLDRIEPTPLPGATVVAAADVDAVLLGSDGAVTGFAEQKGAGFDDMALLEAALSCLAEVAERDLDGGPWRNLPGAGAAGGLGFGLAAFAGARVESGAALVAELIGLAAHLTDADIVVTGEGRADDWSLRGKATGFVANLAKSAGRPVYVVSGSVTPAAAVAFDGVQTLAHSSVDDPAGAVADAARDLAARQ